MQLTNKVFIIKGKIPNLCRPQVTAVQEFCRTHLCRIVVIQPRWRVFEQGFLKVMP